MSSSRSDEIRPIRIERETGWAWCGDERLDLRPKTFAVLRHLVEHPQHLVTKDELLIAAWGDVVVSDAAIASAIRDLRKALDDCSRTPRYIQTVYRRGFRFIGPIAGDDVPSAESAIVKASTPAANAAFVGRDAELARLHALLGVAAAQQRRLVFVTGEAGIGKTTLLEAFLAQVGRGAGIRIGRGQCVEQYGASEAYLPILEALGRLGRQPGSETLIASLKQYAPMWLAQLPGLLSDEDVESVGRRALGSTRERMLREMLDLLDVIGADAPFILALEDLHWSDAATIDLLSLFARRRDPARVLVLATYRPVDVAGRHPLQAALRELQVLDACEEVRLEFLTEAAVREYLAARFPRASFDSDLAALLHRSTGGNALFLVSVIDDLIAQGQMRDVDGVWVLTVPTERVGSEVPRTLSHVIEQHVERLAPHEQAMLAVASVAGAEFSAALATVDGIDVGAGEECCHALASRGRFLRALGVVEWPDGTIAGRYGFIHALHRNALYARVPIGRRVGLHLRIGARLEAAHGSHAGDIAGELAMHFEHGRDFERAIRYRQQAAVGALRHHGYREASQHATRALALLEAVPASPQRDEQELMVQTVLGTAIVATSGWGAPEVARAYERAHRLCVQIGATPQLFPVLLGLSGFYFTRADLAIAENVVTQLVALADTIDDPTVRLAAGNTAGMAAFYRGEFRRALAHLEQAEPDVRAADHVGRFPLDHDPGVSCIAHTAWTLSALGYPERAAQRMRECVDRARTLDHPVTFAMALNFAIIFHHDQGDREQVQELEDLRFTFATEHGFALFLGLGEVFRGWLQVEAGHGDEGLARIRRGLAAYAGVGAVLGTPTFLATLARVCERLGRVEEGLAAVAEAEALSERTGMTYWDAEIQRLRGTLLLRSDAESQTAAAESCFLRALAIARRQDAKAFELRAATSLARLWQRQRKRMQARALLSEVYDWFTEGFATPDLVAARTLLEGFDRRARR